MTGRIARAAGLADRRSPPAVAGTAVDRVTRFTFTVVEPREAAAASARREQLVEHVEGLMGARIVAQHAERPGRVRVTVVTARPVLPAAAEDHASACPHDVVDTFAVLGRRRARGKQVFPVFRGGPGRGIPELGSHLTGTVNYLRGFKSPACEEIGIRLRWLKPAETGNNNVHITASNEAAFRLWHRTCC